MKLEIRPASEETFEEMAAWRGPTRLREYFTANDDELTAKVIFDPAEGAQLHELARTLRNEHVISVTGRVSERLEGRRNPKLPTGDIELRLVTGVHGPGEVHVVLTPS